jgi:hypothetical protein
VGVRPRTFQSVLLASAIYAQTPSPCDRTGMTGLVDRYLADMVKRDPSGLPLTNGVRYTENTAEIQAGEIFKLRAGKIYDIEAMGVSLPYGTKSGWE